LDPARASTDGQHLRNAVAWIDQIIKAAASCLCFRQCKVLQVPLEDFAAAPAATS